MDFVQTAARKVATDAARRGSIPTNEVEDLTHDLVMEVLGEWSGYNPAKSAEAFANRIIQTRYISILRKRKALKRGGRRRPPEPLVQEPIDPRALDPAQQVMVRDTVEAVRRKLRAADLAVFDALRLDPCRSRVAQGLRLEGRAMRTSLERIRKVCIEQGLVDDRQRDADSRADCVDGQ